MDLSNLKKSMEDWRQGRAKAHDKAKVLEAVSQSMEYLEAAASTLEFLQKPWVSLAYDLIPEAVRHPDFAVTSKASDVRYVRVLDALSDRLEAAGMPWSDAAFINETAKNPPTFDSRVVAPGEDIDRLLSAFSSQAFQPLPSSTAQSGSIVDQIKASRRFEENGPTEEDLDHVAEHVRFLLLNLPPNPAYTLSTGSKLPHALDSSNYEERMANVGDFIAGRLPKAREALEMTKGFGADVQLGAESLSKAISRVEKLLESNSRPQVDVLVQDQDLGKPRQVRELQQKEFEDISARVAMSRELEKNLENVKRFAIADDPEIQEHLLSDVTFVPAPEGFRVHMDSAAKTSPVLNAMIPDLAHKLFFDPPFKSRELNEQVLPGHGAENAVSLAQAIKAARSGPNKAEFDSSAFWKSVVEHEDPRTQASMPGKSPARWEKLKTEQLGETPDMASSSQAHQFLEQSIQKVAEAIKARTAAWESDTGKNFQEAHSRSWNVDLDLTGRRDARMKGDLPASFPYGRYRPRLKV